MKRANQILSPEELCAAADAGDICAILMHLAATRPVVKVSTKPYYLAATLALVSQGKLQLIQSKPDVTIVALAYRKELP